MISYLIIIEDLRDAGQPVPPSTSRGRTVEVAA
jgi:hypothetical protein